MLRNKYMYIILAKLKIINCLEYTVFYIIEQTFVYNEKQYSLDLFCFLLLSWFLYDVEAFSVTYGNTSEVNNLYYSFEEYIQKLLLTKNIHCIK